MKMSSAPIDSVNDLLQLDDHHHQKSSQSPSFTTWDQTTFFEQSQVSDFAGEFQATFPFDVQQTLSGSPEEYAHFQMLTADTACSAGVLLDSHGHMYTPTQASIPPASLASHLSPPSLSGSEYSFDPTQPPAMMGNGTIDPRSSSSAGSPELYDVHPPSCADVPPASGRQRSMPQAPNMRFDPTAAASSSTSTARPAKRPRKRTRASRGDSDDEDSGDEEFIPSSTMNTSKGGNDAMKKEEVRRQRIESEQKRRDELRGGYMRLKDALPSSTQKSSKANLLERAVTHIRFLEMTRGSLQARLMAAEREMARLRQVNEALMLGTAEQRVAAAAASAAVQARVQSSF